MAGRKITICRTRAVESYLLPKLAGCVIQRITLSELESEKYGIRFLLTEIKSIADPVVVFFVQEHGQRTGGSGGGGSRAGRGEEAGRR